MKTLLFHENYEAIRYFCKNSKEGFVVAEINSRIIKDELVESLSSDFCIIKTSLKDLVGDDERVNKCDVLVIDEMETYDSKQGIVNLNYNRNWLLNLHCNIIFILRTSMVNELISYSASFWSFVTLHKIFIYRYKSVIQPHFIEDDSDWYLNGLLKYRNDYIVNNDIISKNNRFKSVVREVFQDECEREEIDSYLNKKISKLQSTDVEKIASIFSSILQLSKKLRHVGLVQEAYTCLLFAHKNFNVNSYYKELEVKKLKLLAEINYILGNYEESLRLYETLFNKNTVKYETFSEEDIRITHSNGVELANLLNNIGVVYYKKGMYSEALDCFYGAVKIMNELDDFFVFSNILFNLSLLHYQMEDFHNAIYYIDCAINEISTENALKAEVLMSQCKVLKAYIETNLGELSVAHDLLENSLTLLREELDENCVAIMEAHYVYAVLYLYEKDLKHAKSCATKAFRIMKHLNSDIYVRSHIRQLLGEICFYMNDYREAYSILKIALSHGTKHKAFNDDVVEWIRWAINYCEEKKYNF